MAEPRPLVCVFLKLPPSHQRVLQTHEIAWNVFLPQLNCLNSAFESAEATHPSSEAKKFWSEARHSAAEKMSNLQDVGFMNYNAALGFVKFLDALQRGRRNSIAYQEFMTSTRVAVKQAGIAQEEMLKFREDIRLVIGRITTLMSGGGKDISSFITESSQSLLGLATGVEECNAILEEYRNEIKEVQRQSFDKRDNPPSEEEFQIVQEKWQAFLEISAPSNYRWEILKDEMRGGPEEYGDPSMTSNNATSSTIPMDSPKSHTIPFWRRFFQRISSCLSLKGIC